MNNISEIVDNLEQNIEKLLQKIDSLEQKNDVLARELQVSRQHYHNQNIEIDSLKKKYDALKSANSFLGSEENKRETKLRINSLVREIDYCIAQLSQ